MSQEHVHDEMPEAPGADPAGTTGPAEADAQPVLPRATTTQPRSEPGRPVWDPVTGTWVDETQTQAGATVERPAAGLTSNARPWLAGLAGGVIGALLASAIALYVVPRTGRSVVVERRIQAPAAGGARAASGIVDIAAKARPWVVNINVTGARRSPFGQVVRGTGSGVIIRSDGYIITNAHVVSDADAVSATLASGTTVDARVVGVDEHTDIAVVRADSKDLPPAAIGSAKDLQVGELTVAIGSPLGLRQTVTAGIVSALGRTVERPGAPPLVDMIQTDAAITQGNSGGALLDGNGSLIGINTAIAASQDVGAEGIAFATPVDIAMAVASELIESGRATHPWLGISGANIDAEVARRFGVSEGAVVEGVRGGSPADAAGLKAADIIVGFAGRRIASMDELIVAIREHKVGQKVKLDVVRDGKRMELEATLGERPAGL